MQPFVLYTEDSHSDYERHLRSYKDVLPYGLFEKISKFKRREDCQATILGRLLIWAGLTRLSYKEDCLEYLKYTPYGKPYVDDRTHFNLSHSGRYVVCAFSREDVGIDIEKIKPVEIHCLEHLFSEREKCEIKQSPNPLKEFFRLWTIKESISKAIGKGLALPVEYLEVSDNNIVNFFNTSWYIQELDCFKDYSCNVALKSKPQSITLEKVNF